MQYHTIYLILLLDLSSSTLTPPLLTVLTALITAGGSWAIYSGRLIAIDLKRLPSENGGPLYGMNILKGTILTGTERLFTLTGVQLKVLRTHAFDRKQADERCISIIHNPSTTPKDITRRFPAHIHIDILPSHQVCQVHVKAPLTLTISYIA